MKQFKGIPQTQSSLVSSDNMITLFLLSLVLATDSASTPEMPSFCVLSLETSGGSGVLNAMPLESSMDIVSLLSHTETLSSLPKPKMSSLVSLLSSVRPPVEMAPARWCSGENINGVLEPSPPDCGDSKRSRRLLRLARRELLLLCLDSMLTNQAFSRGVTLYTLLRAVKGRKHDSNLQLIQLYVLSYSWDLLVLSQHEANKS